MYSKGATAGEAAAFGLTLEEAESVTEVWPDNAFSVNVFVAMGSQWRIGMGGATGLDYSALPVVMNMTRIKKKNHSAVFDDLRVLEDSALETIRKASK